MSIFDDLQNFLKRQFSSSEQQDTSVTPENISPNVRSEMSEEDEYLTYFDAQKERGHPEILSLDEIQGDTLTSSLKLSNLMRAPETSSGTVEMAFTRLKDMKNDGVMLAVIGVVRAKSEFLENGIDTIRKNISTTPQSFIDNMCLLAHNMPEHIPEIFHALKGLNDVSSLKAIGAIALNHPEHSQVAIDTLGQMFPPSYDTYRQSDEHHTLGDLTKDDIQEGIREHSEIDTELENVLRSVGLSKPSNNQENDNDFSL